jgi:hypothetical protein
MGAGRNAGLSGGVHVRTGWAGHRDEALSHAAHDFQVIGAESINEARALIPLLLD